MSRPKPLSAGWPAATPAGRRGAESRVLPASLDASPRAPDLWARPPPVLRRAPPRYAGAPCFAGSSAHVAWATFALVGVTPSGWTPDLEPGGPRVPSGPGGRAGLRPPLIDRAVGGPESAGALSRWRLPPRPSLGRLGPALTQGTWLSARCPIRSRMGLCWLQDVWKLQSSGLPLSS
jgi:hypothetical protein